MYEEFEDFVEFTNSIVMDEKIKNIQKVEIFNIRLIFSEILEEDVVSLDIEEYKHFLLCNKPLELKKEYSKRDLYELYKITQIFKDILKRYSKKEED